MDTLTEEDSNNQNNESANNESDTNQSDTVTGEKAAEDKGSVDNASLPDSNEDLTPSQTSEAETESPSNQTTSTTPVNNDESRPLITSNNKTEGGLTIHEYDSADEEHPTLALIFRDALDQPISGLEGHVDIPGQAPVAIRTSTEGHATISAATLPKTGNAKISVRGHDGQLQPACTVDLARCENATIIRSPKIVVPIKLRNHHQAKPTIAPTLSSTASINEHGAWYETNGALQKAWHWLIHDTHAADTHPPTTANNKTPHIVKTSANTAGNPMIVAVGPECPNSENLRLGENNIYRSAIIKAGKRVGLIPQAIAALISAEAEPRMEVTPVLDKEGKPKLHKSGKLKGKPIINKIAHEWNKDSYNEGSDAGGLTQFVHNTWLAHCLKPGYYLNEQCLIKGWVKLEKTAKRPAKFVFVLANGNTTTQPWNSLSDEHVQLCLKQRFEPEWSIMAAADYGKSNLMLLEQSGFKLKDLNDGEKARLMYLMHHEGEGAGPLFIKNELSKIPKGKFSSSTERLRSIFVGQVGEHDVKTAIAKTNGDVEAAYRRWLADYINHSIVLTNYCCDKNKFQNVASIFEVFTKITGG